MHYMQLNVGMRLAAWCEACFAFLRRPARPIQGRCILRSINSLLKISGSLHDATACIYLAVDCIDITVLAAQHAHGVIDQRFRLQVPADAYPWYCRDDLQRLHAWRAHVQLRFTCNLARAPRWLAPKLEVSNVLWTALLPRPLALAVAGGVAVCRYAVASSYWFHSHQRTSI